MREQVTIQSFDWGALMRMRQVEPRLPLVALTNYDFLQVGQPGASPWLGGIDIDDFGGDLVAAADVLRRRRDLAGARLPAERQGHRPGLPAVRHRPRWSTQAHAPGSKVDPVDGRRQADDGALIDDGVDGIITDYPDRLREVMAERGYVLPEPAYASPFDIQAPPRRQGVPAGEHPGGVPVRAREPGRLHAGARHRRDRGRHARRRSTTARSTSVALPRHRSGATRDDPKYPYVGELINDLTLAPDKTLDCGGPAGRSVPAEHGSRPSPRSSSAGPGEWPPRHPAEHRDQDQPCRP